MTIAHDENYAPEPPRSAVRVLSTSVAEQASTEHPNTLARAIASSGASRAAVAKACGVSGSRVAAWCDGRASINLSHIERLAVGAPTVYHALMSIMVARDERAAECLQRDALLLMKDVGEVAGAITESLLDGNVSAKQARTSDKKLRRAERRIARLRVKNSQYL